MQIMTTLAVKSVIEDVLPRLEAAAGAPLRLTFEPTAVNLERIAAGARADAAILTAGAIDELTAQGILVPAGRVDLARSLVGMAVKAGAPKPDLSTLAAFERTLREARSIVYSRGGASGIFFAKLIERLGLAAMVNAKAIIVASGFTAEVVARSEAELAVQQISELMVVPGVDIVGPLPPEAQESLLFSGAVFAGTAHAAAAAAVLHALADPSLASLYERKGLLPVAGTRP